MNLNQMQTVKNNQKPQSLTINMMKMKRYFSLTVLMLQLCALSAQPIDTARFNVDYTPVIMGLNKLNQGTVLVDSGRQKVNFNYYIMPQRVDLSFTPSQVKPAKLQADVMKRLYRNFLRVGFGYPVTPLAQLSMHNFDNRKFSYGLNFNHFSSWAPQIGKKMKNYAYAPTSDTKAHLFFNRFFRHQTLYSSVGYNHKLAHLFGFNKELGYDDYFYSKEYQDTLKNDFHHLYAEIGIRSNHVLEDRRLKQDVRLNYDFIHTRRKDMEHAISLNSYLAYDARFLKLNGSQNYRADINFDYFNNSWGNIPKDSLGVATRNTFLFEIKPTVNFTINEYHVILGVGLPIAQSTLQNKLLIPVYPVAELQLGLVPKIMNVYVGVDGKTEFNSLKNLLFENPYLNTSIDSLRFTRTPISVYGGIKGNLVKKLNYRISARYSYTKDMPLFMIDTAALLKNQFNVVYTDANILNVCANINWQVLDQLYINLDANYWGYYGLTNVEHAWHKPSFEFSLGGTYFHKDKFLIDVNMDLGFDRWAFMPLQASEDAIPQEPGSTEPPQPTFDNDYVIAKMKPILNFGVGFEYFFSPQFSAFARINNLACQYYSKYYDFPSFGINALIGVTYSFGDESLKRQKKKK